MSRKVHFEIPGHAHELTFSCYRNRTFLLDDDACIFLAEAVNKAREKHNFKVWAYVFMPDHVHILIYPEKDNYSISKILLTIKQSVARRVLIRARKGNAALLNQFRTGIASKKYRFWQDGGGYDRNIVNRATLMKTIDYIHDNPVRKDLVKSPGDWKWSSFGDWHENRQGPIKIDKDDFPLL
ncbi:MAG: transposase [Candidatus Zixiibacteriota bacterium]|nr:MAG: transposase [candidate division Zixibacteria bacterium]